MITNVQPTGEPVVYVGDFDLVESSVSDISHSDHQYSKIYNRTVAPAFDATVGYTFLGEGRNEMFFDCKQYGVRWSFKNMSRSEITITDRLGVPITLSSDLGNSDSPQKPYLEICRSSMFADEKITQQTLANIQKLGTIQGADINGFIKSMSGNIYSGYYRCVSIKYLIPVEDIMHHDGKMYHVPSDLLISLKSIEDTPKHPYSAQNTYTGPMKFSNFEPNVLDLNLAFRYFTNETNATPKYIKVANKVFKLYPQKHNPEKLLKVVAPKDKSNILESSREYIEVIYPTSVETGNHESKSFRVNRISLVQAREKYHIFDTYDEACVQDIVIERAEQKLKDKIEQLEIEKRIQEREFRDKIKETEREYSEKIRKLETESEQKNIAYDELKKSNNIELEKIKEMREEKAHERKSDFEFLKFLTGILASMLALVPLVLKLKAKQ